MPKIRQQLMSNIILRKFAETKKILKTVKGQSSFAASPISQGAHRNIQFISKPVSASYRAIDSPKQLPCIFIRKFYSHLQSAACNMISFNYSAMLPHKRGKKEKGRGPEYCATTAGPVLCSQLSAV